VSPFVFIHKNLLDNFFVYLQVTLQSVILRSAKGGHFESGKLAFCFFSVYWVAGYHGKFFKKIYQSFFVAESVTLDFGIVKHLPIM
jgi:hypothetical protein